MRIPNFMMSVLLITMFAACNNNKKEETATRTTFFDKTGIDSTARPQDNFFQYANGQWMKNTTIPSDQSGWGSFYTLYDENQKHLKEILETAAATGAAKGNPEQKLGDYYTSGMDTLSIEKLGAKPLKPVLDKIEAIKDYKELMAYIAEANVAGDDDGLISAYVGADEKNSSVNILSLYQTGLSLPEKDYYTKNDSATQAARNALLKYASTLFSLAGADAATAGKNAHALLALETELAKSNRSPVEQRDPQKNYNKVSIIDLDKQSPNINWPQIFNKMNVKLDSVKVGQPEYYVALSKLLPVQPIDVWKIKVKFEYIANHASLLSKPFIDAGFEYNKTFNGKKTDDQRWKKIVGRVNGGLGELLGQLYVKKYFTEAAKHRMDELVNNLQKAFEERIKKLDWMSDSTKKRALVKLNTFLKKIGYPSKWKNFDDVVIDKTDFFANAKSVQRHQQKEQIGKIGKPVDRTEWLMSPPTVNAYYNPTNNEIVFPAGILQFPFFDVNADDAVNYGAIGMVIGHEMTHGFDDQGSQYDEKGNMQNWWGSADAEKFKSKTGGVVKQYNAFTVLDSLHVNGELTLGENLADIGGLAIAYDAFKMTRQGQGNEKIDGLTPDQRFFLGYAQVWRLKDRDESMRVRITTDPHSPEMYRVNGPAMNFDPFYKAFDVKEGDKMYLKPEDRAKIW
ncbi:MAG: M13 family metallopeptidase [Chitinophagaceae bacterium]|nr:M13 family metallopeptidase [Chitinophagaceae bacterium]